MATFLDAPDAQIRAIAETMMASFEENDPPAYLKLFAPGSTVWLSYLEGEMPVEQNAALLGELYAGFLQSFSYDDIRLQKTDKGYLQQHVMTLTAKTGETLTVDACGVYTLNDEGLITHSEEYFDSKVIGFGAKQLETMGGEAPVTGEWAPQPPDSVALS